EAAFVAIREEFEVFAEPLGISSAAIPTVAPDGDNVVHASVRMPWYGGRTVLQWLETVEVSHQQDSVLRFLVQGVRRPNGDFRGYAGIVASGAIAKGDEVLIARSAQRTRVAGIVTFDGDLARAETGSAVTLTLADQVDLARGDVLAHPETPSAMA